MHSLLFFIYININEFKYESYIIDFESGYNFNIETKIKGNMSNANFMLCQYKDGMNLLHFILNCKTNLLIFLEINTKTVKHVE